MPQYHQAFHDPLTGLPNRLDHRSASADVATRVIEAAGEPFSVDGHTLTDGASIGIAIHPADGSDVKTMLRAAERAMYSAKVAGGNGFRFMTD